MYSGILKELIKLDDNGDYYYDWDRIGEIPEFSVLKDTPQTPKWHSEGCVWNHTRMVCESMLERASAVPQCDRYICLAAALFHDIGKGVTTKLNSRGDWSSYGHDEAGVGITRNVLWDIDVETREQICLLVKYHMKPLKVFDEKNYLTKIKDIALSGINMYYLYLLKECDLDGSICEEGYYKEKDYDKLDEFFQIYISLKPHFWKIKEYKEKEMKNKEKRTAVMMIGLPGSGKDTYISKNFTDPIYAPISRDEIRIEMGMCGEGEKCLGTKEEEDTVTDEFNRRLLIAIRIGKIPVINNTNLSKKRRNVFKDLLKGYDVNWQYVYLQAPDLDTNKERRKGQIKPEILDDMMKRLEFPEEGEYDDLKIHISNDEE